MQTEGYSLNSIWKNPSFVSGREELERLGGKEEGKFEGGGEGKKGNIHYTS